MLSLAEIQIRQARLWWAENRADAPGAISDGLERAYATISELPRIGRAVPDAPGNGVRRYLIPRLPYSIYYRIDGDEIQILAFWHSSRGAPPPI